MSISPPPFSPARSQSTDEGNDLENDYVQDDDDQHIDSARSIISSFDLYKNAIDRLRSTIKSLSTDEQLNSLEDFKPLSTRSNAWLYMRMHDDLLSLLLDYLRLEPISIQSTALSILANIACEQTSHEQIFETDLIDIVCRKVIDVDHIDIKNRCFRLLGNVCTIEEAARKMIDADLARSMGNVLSTCTDPACLHSTIRCARKLSTFALCRDPMLDSMCLLSICKQLFASKIPLRKEAMKAVLEWNIESSDRSRCQLREGEIFRFLIETIQSKSDKEYRHIAFRLLNNLLRHADMRTEFGHRNGLDFLLEMIDHRQYQSTYEHFKYLGLYCVCCQEVNNRRLIREDTKKLQLFFDYLGKYQYRSNFLDLLLTAIRQFLYDDQSLTIFVKQMQFIERMSDLLESAVLVKYEMNEKKLTNDDEDRKRRKTTHATTQRVPMMIDLNESVFTEFVENTNLDDERQSTGPSTISIEIRRRTESLIFILLSKISYETTDNQVRRCLYNRRLISLLLRYIYSSDEPNPRSVRILHRLTKSTDCAEFLPHLSLPHLLEKHFFSSSSFDLPSTITGDDQYLFDILLNDNRAFFQRLSWTNEHNRLRTIENSLLKNLEHSINTPYMINEIVRQLNDDHVQEKFFVMLTLIATLKPHHLQSILFDRCSGYRYLLDSSDDQACFWAFRTLIHRLNATKKINDFDEYFRQLEIHSAVSRVTSVKLVELDVNNERAISVNTHLLSAHSNYFKTLFSESFREHQQTKISFHLPETISIESFEHLIALINNENEPIQIDRIGDLFHLCDQYLLDYLPYRLVSFVLREYLHGNPIDFVDIVSKPNLISSLVRACFSHLLTSPSNNSIEIFSKLIVDYSNELRTLIQSILQQKSSLLDHQYSPFLS